MFPFLVGFLIKLSTILTLAIHFSIFRKLFIPLFEEYDQQLNCIITMSLFLVHQNYVGIDTEKDPFILSVVVTDANNHNVPQYRAVLWRKNVSQIVLTLSYDNHYWTLPIVFVGLQSATFPSISNYATVYFLTITISCRRKFVRIRTPCPIPSPPKSLR